MNPNKQSLQQAWLIIGFAVIAIVGWLQFPELRAEEPRRAVVSMEMFLSGEYSSPTLNGWAYYNKPPFFNWVMALFFSVFGSMNEVIVRLPGILSFLLTGFIFYRFVKKENTVVNPVLLIIGLFTTAEFLFLATLNAGEIDLFFMLITSIQLISIYHFSQKGDFYALFLSSYALTAIGFMTKGLPSLVFQAITLLGWFIYTKRFKRLLSIAHLTGIMLFGAAVALMLWYYSTGSSVEDLLVRQLKEAGQRSAAETGFLALLQNIVAYPFRLLVWLLPWSFLIYAFWDKENRSKITNTPLLSYAFIVLVCNLPIYWFSNSPKSRYIFMLLPWALILLFSVIRPLNKANRWEKLLSQITKWLPLLILVFPVLLWIIPDAIRQPPSTGNLQLSILIVFVFLLFTVRYTQNLIYRVALIMLCARIVIVNMILIPIQDAQPQLSYKENVAALCERTGHESIHFIGKPYHFASDLMLFGDTLASVHHQTAPLIPYQIPYYIGLETQKIMEFDTIATFSQWYLAEKEHLPAGAEAIDSIHDYWLKRELYLFRMNRASNKKSPL